jgi:hypothetical protein
MEKETFTYIPEDIVDCMGNKITNIHIFKPGEYRGKTWTKEIVNQIVANFKTLKEKAGFQPPVRIGHRGDSSVENAKNVIGYIEDLHSDEEGNLFADTDIFTDADAENFKRLKRSVELGPYETNSGEEFDTTVWGLGLVDIPQVERLAEVNVYSKKMEEQMAKKEEKKVEKELAKVGDVCKMPDGAEGKMMMDGDKMVCKSQSKMDKEEEKESEEESKEEKDSAEETSEEKDAKVDLDKEEADDEESDEESEEEEEQMDKKTEMVSMSKDEVAELKAAKEKLEKIEAEEVTTKLAKRMERVEEFTKGEVKIIPAMLEKEKEFVETLSNEQFDKYVELKEEMPNLVELDKDFGKQKSSKEEEETEELKAQKESKTRELVIDTTMRKEGLTREQAEKLIK